MHGPARTRSVGGVPPPVVKAALEEHPSFAPLFSGSVVPASFTFAFEHVEPINAAFRRMVRGNEFDVSEMAITTYLVAKEHGKPFTALPVFPVRMAPHPAIVKNVNAGINSPLDLNGRRVGVRAYTVTTGVWARYVLADAGVDLGSITWVVVDEEHVREYQLPPSVESHPKGSLVDMLRAGEIDAAIGIGKVDFAEIAPLFADPAAAGREFIARTGIFPINHTVVVKDELLRARPELAHELVDVFQAAHEKAGNGIDSSSIGLEANQRTIETLMTFAQQQGLISRAYALDAIFAL